MVKWLREWFKGYDGAPLWLCFCRLVFAVSALSFIALFFGPAILSGDMIGFWMYQEWTLTHASFLYILVVVATFTLTVISGIPTFLYEQKRIKTNRRRS
jgi:phosphotransferase system  glucose/maltose/N-acetylglucosamine-specific IIC component